MKERIIFINVIFIFLTNFLFCQKEDYRWMFGSPDGSPNNAPHFGGMDLDFNNKELKIIINHKPFYMNSHNASICDEDGEILFYTNGCYFIDKNNNKIVGSDTLNPIYDYFESCKKQGSLFPRGLEYPQGGLIIKRPETHNKIIYFSLETVLGNEFPYSPHVLMTEVEYQDSNQIFKVLSKNVPILEDTLPGSMAAILSKDNLAYWIIVRRDRNNIFNIIKVTKDSIYLSTQQIGEYFQDGNLVVCTFSPDGKKYASYCKRHGLELLDFDRESGKFSNYKKINVLDTFPTGQGGVCFSPDSRFVYVSTYVDLFQFDLTKSDIKASEVFIDKTNDVTCNPGLQRKTRFGPMVLGPDCRIYMVSNYQQTCMNVIMYPNKKGKECRFVQQAIRFPYLNHSSIPNFPHYRIDEPYPCDSTIKFNLTQVEDYNFSSQLVYYPNPVQEQLNIVFPQPIIIESYCRIFDLNGRVVKQERILEGSNEIHLDCRSLSSGMYIYQIKSNNGAYAGGKFIKYE